MCQISVDVVLASACLPTVHRVAGSHPTIGMAGDGGFGAIVLATLARYLGSNNRGEIDQSDLIRIGHFHAAAQCQIVTIRSLGNDKSWNLGRAV